MLRKERPNNSLERTNLAPSLALGRCGLPLSSSVSPLKDGSNRQNQMTVIEAINQAEAILPGIAAAEGTTDTRWQAIINIGDFIQSNPAEVWLFIARWGKSRNEDLRNAIATCLLEHLLQYHFVTYFPQIRALANKSAFFADTFSRCWKFGQSEEPQNAKRFDRLKQQCRKRRRK